MINSVFVQQDEARAYVESIVDATERLLTEAALARAMGAWLNEPSYRERLQDQPINLLARGKVVG